MIPINVTVDNKAVLDSLRELGRQGPFALAAGITMTVKQAQTSMQNRMPQAFHLRRTEQLFRQAVKATFATKAKPEGNVRIEGPQSGAISTAARVAGMILRHEEGGTKTSSAFFRAGNKLLPMGFYLPTKGLRTANQNPPRAIYPANIGATLRVDPSGKAYYAASQKGRKRQRGAAGREKSYFVTEKGIFERRHLGSFSAVRLLWAFERSITLPPRLKFYETVGGTINAHLTRNLETSIAEAIRTAFPPR